MIEKISVGSEVKGIVLWIDFVNGFAEISLCAKLMTRINSTQGINTFSNLFFRFAEYNISIFIDGIISFPIGIDKKNNLHAEVLLVKDDFALVVLRGRAGNRQIVFLPTRLHPNDFFPDLRAFRVGDCIKIAITK